MIKLIKKTFLLLIAISIFITSIPNVKAATEWGPDMATVPGGGTGGNGKTDESNKILDFQLLDDGETKITKTYNCSFKRKLTQPTRYLLRVYNQENIDIIGDGFTIDTNLYDLPVAGTMIGINLEEVHTVTKEITAIMLDVGTTIQKYKKEYVCFYKDAPVQMLPPIDNELSVQYEKTEEQSTTSCNVKEKITNSSTECPKPDIGCILESGPIYQSTTTELEEEEFKVDYTINYKFEKGEIKSKPLSISLEDEERVDDCITYAANIMGKKGNYYTEATYNVELLDSNDANGINVVSITSKQAEKNAYVLDKNGNIIPGCDTKFSKKCWFPGSNGPRMYTNDDELSLRLYDVREMHFYYAKGKTCLNVQTAQARYIGENENCIKDLEVTIENDSTPDGLTHWHYFIPLNAKSQDGLIIKMLSGNNITLEQCLSLMKSNYIGENGTPIKNGGYTKYITPKQPNEKFVGDYICYNCGTKKVTWKTNSVDEYKVIKDNGCRLSTIESIPIEQLFYKETSNNTLNGFNFYYKPIDINNSNQVDVIFPNGIDKNIFGAITTPTLWDDWYKAQTEPTASKDKEPDLSKSFDTATYIAQNVSANEVRNYTKNNPYTSWSKMNLDGTSSYISSNGAIKRNGDATKNIYKLGCGPLNESEYVLDKNGLPKTDWLGNKIKNILYVKECGTK